MKFHIFFISLFLITLTIFPREYLITIENLNEGKYDFTVIKKVKNHFIILANDNDIARINTRNYTYQILDTEPKAKDYYLIFAVDPLNPRKAAVFDTKVFKKYGRVLYAFDDCMLMQADIEDLNRITEYTTKLVYLRKDPIDFNIEVDPAILAMHKRPVQTDPLIEEMIELVNKDSADMFIRTLCDFRNRYARDKYNKEELVPYIKKKFEEYGCDSIFETDLGSNIAPEVTGVRFGKVNPSLESFSIIGGHSDNKLTDGGDDYRHQGAWDNASGAVGYLEAARVLSHFTFENTIVFSMFNAEEIGLIGSDRLLSNFKDAGYKSVSGFAYDMCGWGDYVRYSPSDVTGGSDFAERAQEICDAYNLDQYLDVRINPKFEDEPYVRQTDIVNFSEHGFIGMSGFGTGGGSIHTIADTINDRYDAQKLAYTTLLGIIVTADYSVPIDMTSAKPNYFPNTENPKFGIVQKPQGSIIINYLASDDVNPLSFTIYNSLGKAVAALVPIKQESGNYTAVWNYANSNNSVAKGVYILICKTTKGIMSEKIIYSR